MAAPRVRGRRGAGRDRPRPHERGFRRPARARVPLFGPARRRQDDDGPPPRRRDQLQLVRPPDGDSLRHVRVVRGSARGPLARHPRDRRSHARQGGPGARSHRSRGVRAVARQAEGLHHRRGPRDLLGRLPGPAEDARGTAVSRRLHPGDDRTAQDPRDDPVALPALRLPAPHGRRGGRPPHGHRGAGGVRGRGRGAGGKGKEARRRARGAGRARRGGHGQPSRRPLPLRPGGCALRWRRQGGRRLGAPRRAGPHGARRVARSGAGLRPDRRFQGLRRARGRGRRAAGHAPRPHRARARRRAPRRRSGGAAADRALGGGGRARAGVRAPDALRDAPPPPLPPVRVRRDAAPLGRAGPRLRGPAPEARGAATARADRRDSCWENSLVVGTGRDERGRCCGGRRFQEDYGRCLCAAKARSAPRPRFAVRSRRSFFRRPPIRRPDAAGDRSRSGGDAGSGGRVSRGRREEALTARRRPRGRVDPARGQGRSHLSRPAEHRDRETPRRARDGEGARGGRDRGPREGREGDRRGRAPPRAI